MSESSPARHNLAHLVKEIYKLPLAGADAFVCLRNCSLRMSGGSLSPTNILIFDLSVENEGLHRNDIF